MIKTFTIKIVFTNAISLGLCFTKLTVSGHNASLENSHRTYLVCSNAFSKNFNLFTYVERDSGKMTMMFS